MAQPFSMRDLYGNMGAYDTTETTIVDNDERQHYANADGVNKTESTAAASDLSKKKIFQGVIFLIVVIFLLNMV